MRGLRAKGQQQFELEMQLKVARMTVQFRLLSKPNPKLTRSFCSFELPATNKFRRFFSFLLEPKKMLKNGDASFKFDYVMTRCIF